MHLLVLTLHCVDYEPKCEQRYTLRGETLTLVCPARTHSDVADVTRFDDIMQSLHLNRSKGRLTNYWGVLTVSSIGVSLSNLWPGELLMSFTFRACETLALKEVDVIKLKSLQTLLHTRKNMFATQSMLVHVAILIRILSTGNLIDVVLAANDIVHLQRPELPLS